MCKPKILSFILGISFLIGIESAFSDGLVDIGGSRKMYMKCIGTGSPTVVLIAGAKDRGDSGWDTLPLGKEGASVFSEVGKFTRVCTYDRPGTISIKEETFERSRSDPVPQPITAKDASTDLHALLIASKEKGPYVIVGHSAGALFARLYAAMYPEGICGLVLVDGTTDDLRNRWTPEQWKVFDYSVNSVPKDLQVYKALEMIDFKTSFYQLLDVSMVRLWKIPTTILTSDQVPDAKRLIDLGLWPASMTQESAEQIVEAIIASQGHLARLFTPPAKHIKNTKSGHYIQKDNPQLVIDAIREHVNNAACKS